jgi:DNA replication protein DnaC
MDREAVKSVLHGQEIDQDPGHRHRRLMHHAHVCQTSGDSIRLTQALAGKE